MNNWAQACHGPLLVAAVSICDYNLTLVQQQVELSIPRLSRAIEACGLDGGWFEGTYYGSYSSYFLVNPIALIESAVGTD